MQLLTLPPQMAVFTFCSFFHSSLSAFHVQRILLPNGQTIIRGTNNQIQQQQQQQQHFVMQGTRLVPIPGGPFPQQQNNRPTQVSTQPGVKDVLSLSGSTWIDVRYLGLVVWWACCIDFFSVPCSRCTAVVPWDTVTRRPCHWCRVLSPRIECGSRCYPSRS